jgi:hypothetical protein
MKLPITPLKNYKIHIAVFIILIIYLLSADMIFNSLIPVKEESSQYYFDTLPESANMKFGIDSTEVIDIEWKTVINIHGWAFVPGANATTTKKYVVLNSENSTYIFGTSLLERPDVVNTIGSNEMDYLYSGFYTNIPIYSIRNGKYRIGILLKNETTSSFSLAGKGITKIGTGVIPGLLSEMIGPFPVNNKSDIRYGLDETRKKEIGDINVLSVIGWAFVPGDKAPGTKKYVVLTSQNATYFFDTIPAPRPDVALFFNNNSTNVENSGFHANIPLTMIANGTYNLGIIIQDNDYAFQNFRNIMITVPMT